MTIIVENIGFVIGFGIRFLYIPYLRDNNKFLSFIKFLYKEKLKTANFSHLYNKYKREHKK